MNRVILVGHLTHDPELRYTSSGKPVTSIRLATNEYVGTDGGGERREHVEYHSATVWGVTGEAAAKHLAKGRQVLVEGSLRTHSWDDQQTGQRRFRTEILASRVEFLGAGSQVTRQPAAAATTGDADPATIPA